jgi:hypothetical protein
MRRFIRVVLGAALMANGSHALWRFGLHQGRFFAIASLLIAISGFATICTKGIE